MRVTSYFAAGFALAGSCLSGVNAIQQVTRNGGYLYTADGNRFYIKGVAYQEQGATTFIDSLSNGTACVRDLPYLQQLGVNTIRAYSVDSSLNHDSCMRTFSNAGIYAIIDLSLPGNGSINSDAPTWTTNLLDLYIETIDVFSKYDNVLAYNVGDGVVTAANGTAAAAFVKAAARDVKAYINSIKSSALVGYASKDGDSSWLVPLANYLPCDTTSSTSGAGAIDLFGLSNYEWCGNSTFQASYANTYNEFYTYNVPAYFSEFGCITTTPRVWTEVAALFSSQMSPVWSGGVAFSYFPAPSTQGQYGMVTISPDGNTVTTSTDFINLQAQYASATPPDSPPQSAAGTTNYPLCPQQSSTWLASTALPPTPNLAACQCLQNNLGCQFAPSANNYTAIVGGLLDNACSLIGQSGGNCNAISANGSTGQYGLVSECDPTVALSYVMTKYYLAEGSTVQACSFGGNGIVNSKVPSTASADAVATSCLSSATSTSVPTLPATFGGSSSSEGNSGSSSNGGSSSSGAVPAIPAASDARTLLGMGVVVGAGITSGFWIMT